MLLLHLVFIGSIFRLYTEEFYVKELSTEGIPEMQRSNLVSSVIQVCDLLKFIFKVIKLQGSRT